VPLLHAGDLMMAIVADRTGKPQLGLGQFSGEFVARKGHDALLALVVADHAPLAVPTVAQVRERREATEVAWREWCDMVPYDGQDRDLVLRSMLVLKLLTYTPTGAMAAAATTSLPERIGGDRNYDYRYGWIRDTSFVLDSYIQLGLTQDVQGTLAWMLSCISATAPVIHPFYGLRGHVPDAETELRLPGYRGSAPVRAGNRAVGQPQLGCYGDLLECVWLAVDRAGAHLDPASADLLGALGNHVCDVWTEPDCGIWELDQRRHNTFSKVGCWVALDRLVKLSERGQVSGRDVDRWRAEQDAIRSWIDQNCWSKAKRSYVGHAGSEDLDASLLLLARSGFLDGQDRRFTQTIRAIRAELAEGPLLYRFTGARHRGHVRGVLVLAGRCPGAERAQARGQEAVARADRARQRPRPAGRGDRPGYRGVPGQPAAGPVPSGPAERGRAAARLGTARRYRRGRIRRARPRVCRPAAWAAGGGPRTTRRRVPGSLDQLRSLSWRWRISSGYRNTWAAFGTPRPGSSSSTTLARTTPTPTRSPRWRPCPTGCTTARTRSARSWPSGRGHLMTSASTPPRQARPRTSQAM
jgi:hypothetical protein